MEKISEGYLALQARLTLSETKNAQLQDAHYNEKKRRRKRGKNVFEEMRSMCNSESVFYSPSKIKQARDLKLQSEQDKEQ